MKPNILYFFCDELRTDALSVYSTPFPEIQTPNIDWIGENGTVFENCFCNSPICVPSRTSLFTALYPEDTGVYCNEAGGENYVFDEKYMTIPEYLQENGYHTASFGKSDMVHGMQPFEHYVPEGSGMKWGKEIMEEKGCIRPAGFPTMLGGIYEEEAEYPPNAVVKNAIAWLSRQEEPYFARVSFLQPHTPVFPLPEYAAAYENCPFSDQITASDTISRYEKCFAQQVDASNLTASEIFHTRSYYYGLVKWIDDQIGMVLDWLRQSGQIDNTIIIFGADHGAALGENGCYAKHTYAPYVHRVPLLIRNPYQTDERKRIKECCCNLDMAKTICGMVGISPHPQFKGRDIFHSKSEYVYATIGYGNKGSMTFPNMKHGIYYGGRGWPRRGCIRTDRFRLDMNLRIDGEPCVTEEDRDVFFVDCMKDPSECVNMLHDTQYREIIQDLTDKLLTHCFPEAKADSSV